VPGGPRKSIHAPSAGKFAALRRGPPARRAATTPKLRRPPSLNRKRSTTPPRSALTLAAPASAPAARRLSSPPRICVWPRPSVSVVARTVPGAGDGVEERQVLARLGLLRELDVVGDHPGAGAAQPIDRACVQ